MVATCMNICEDKSSVIFTHTVRARLYNHPQLNVMHYLHI